MSVIGAGTSLEVGDTLEVGRAGAVQLAIFSGGLTTAPDVLIDATNVVVSWPGYIAGFTLQKATGFPAASWQPISAPGNTITLQVSGGSSFFRLIMPQRLAE